MKFKCAEGGRLGSAQFVLCSLVIPGRREPYRTAAQIM